MLKSWPCLRTCAATLCFSLWVIFISSNLIMLSQMTALTGTAAGDVKTADDILARKMAEVRAWLCGKAKGAQRRGSGGRQDRRRHSGRMAGVRRGGQEAKHEVARGNSNVVPREGVESEERAGIQLRVLVVLC
jgi:hypothetical protein